MNNETDQANDDDFFYQDDRLKNTVEPETPNNKTQNEDDDSFFYKDEQSQKESLQNKWGVQKDLP